MTKSAPLLPLDAAALETVAVIGPNADVARIQGGGSADVTPYRAVSPLEGISARLGDGERVRHEPGCVIARTIPRLDERLLATEAGEVGLVAEHVDGRRDVARRLPMAWDHTGSVRLSGTLRVRESGPHALQLRTNGGARMVLGDRVTETAEDGRAELETVLDEGTTHPFTIELAAPPDQPGRLGLDLRHRRPLPDDLIDRAARAAAEADVAIVVVGTDNDWETEGRDRTSLSLPGAQDELIERVVASNPRTVVVVNSGAPVAMPWADRVPAIVQLWFPGQEAGHALADVLFGDVSPSGRLPTTFPARLEDTPAFAHYPGQDGHVLYDEGLLVGYRWYDSKEVAPLFPFGHGLSYTTFAYGPLRAAVTGNGSDVEVSVEVDVTNTGARDGAEVVQLYVSERAPAVERPPKQLRAFAKVELGVGESRTVPFTLGRRAFARWDPPSQQWRVDGGDYELAAAASATDIRSRTTVRLPYEAPS